MEQLHGGHLVSHERTEEVYICIFCFVFVMKNHSWQYLMIWYRIKTIQQNVSFLVVYDDTYNTCYYTYNAQYMDPLVIKKYKILTLSQIKSPFSFLVIDDESQCFLKSATSEMDSDFETRSKIVFPKCSIFFYFLQIIKYPAHFSFYVLKFVHCKFQVNQALRELIKASETKISPHDWTNLPEKSSSKYIDIYIFEVLMAREFAEWAIAQCPRCNGSFYHLCKGPNILNTILE